MLTIQCAITCFNDAESFSVGGNSASFGGPAHESTGPAGSLGELSTRNSAPTATDSASGGLLAESSVNKEERSSSPQSALSLLRVPESVFELAIEDSFGGSVG